MGVDLLTPTHLIFLGLLAVLLFGAKRVPEMGRSLGNGMREFKQTLSGMDGVTEAVNGVNEIRSAVSPTNIARAAIPGVAEMQDTVGAMKSVVPGATSAATTEPGAAAESAPASSPAAAPEP
jgi:sec-independent protein translocase protein TatA